MVKTSSCHYEIMYDTGAIRDYNCSRTVSSSNTNDKPPTRDTQVVISMWKLYAPELFNLLNSSHLNIEIIYVFVGFKIVHWRIKIRISWNWYTYCTRRSCYVCYAIGKRLRFQYWNVSNWRPHFFLLIKHDHAMKERILFKKYRNFLV